MTEISRRALAILSCLLPLGLAPSVDAHEIRVRTPVRIPDIPGYLTLKCDFHTHTVFSDGSVWPDVRAEEAWREGLDAVALTDHIEYQPHARDLPTSHERPYEIARPHGERLDLIVIKGSEVTRSMPPGHLNAIFIDTVAPLETDSWRDALQAAHDQGAIVFWNHPGWRGQQPDGVARWYPEHTELVEAGLLQGVEVVNEREYYPEAHRWSLEKNLILLANSDIHSPLNLDYHVHHGDHRPLTLVFAKERSAASIKEALLARRTAAWSGEVLVGKEELLRPLYEASVTLLGASARAEADDSALFQVRNDSDVSFELRGTGAIVDGVRPPERVDLVAGRTSLIELDVDEGAAPGTRRLDLEYEVVNLKLDPERGLRVRFALEVEVVAPRP